ncbi:MAG: DUF4905 domain-containing protein, partial [Ignavibacteriales bacterium]|nr:DUF4905 domain-containing protein [Ignavibacteriales bacterium]
MLNLFSKKQLRPVWQYTCDGILWRLKVSNNRLILGEDRNTEAKTVSYFCVEETTGKILWKNLKFDEPFWIGINAVYNNVAYFHEYESPS